MDRFTRKTENDTYVISCSALCETDEGYSGEPAERLAAFENILEYLVDSQTTIPMELEKLRQEGKDKTVKFRELMAQKLANTNTIMLLERFGIQGLRCDM